MVKRSNKSIYNGDLGCHGDPSDPNFVEQEVLDLRPKKKAKEISPAKNWTFTWHFDEDYDDNAIDELIKSEKTLGGVVGKEVCPTTGRKHFQGYVEFEWKSRPFSLGLPKEVHWEAAKASGARNFKYCGKDKNFRAWGSMKKHVPFKFDLFDENGSYFPWQLEMIEIIKGEPDPRIIYWIYETEGNTGKSDFGKHLNANYPKLGVIPGGGRAADMKNMIIEILEKNGDFPRCIIIDLPRGFDQTHLSYPGIEELKNMFFYSGKFHGGVVNGPKPHMIIFSNERPNTSKLSLDRWRIGLIENKELVWTRF